MREILKDELLAGKFWTHSRTIIDGCTPVSPGCRNCWLSGMYNRNLPGLATVEPVITPEGKFNGKVIPRLDRLEGIIPKGKRKPRVWTYWSDVFHQGVSDNFRRQLLSVATQSPSDYHIIITKRPEVAASSFYGNRPLRNVIILVTMEDQKRLQQRWKAAVTLANEGWHVGILAEPLLSPLNIDPSWLDMMCWLITGGESGRGARPAHPDWFRSLRDQAQSAGVPFMFKQWGEWRPHDCGHSGRIGCWNGSQFRDGWGDIKDAHNNMVKVSKKACGARQLDGREWLEVPEMLP